MPHAESTEAIRRLTGEIFARLGWCDAQEAREALLICGESYCGRRFDVANGCAIWLIDEDRLTFFAADGTLAETIHSASKISAPRRLAA